MRLNHDICDIAALVCALVEDEYNIPHISSIIIWLQIRLQERDDHLSHLVERT
jgi:hypothetical protein